MICVGDFWSTASLYLALLAYVPVWCHVVSLECMKGSVVDAYVYLLELTSYSARPDTSDLIQSLR